MDELKLLIEAVANLPTLTLWVLVGYLIYKLAVIGSIYGLIRFGIEKLHGWLVTPKEQLVNIKGTIDALTITSDGSHSALIGQLERLRGKNAGIASRYIHHCSVQWLREAIDAKEKLDFESKK